jgi:cytoplasmic iron level regulating protein YaaA (DUF328/UPF0246 family)
MTARLPLILLPPSEGKAPGGDGPPWTRGSMAIDLDERRAEALIALAKSMRGSELARAKLLDVKERALQAATAANRSARTSPTRPAIERYTGVLYDALDHGSLTAAQRRRLDECVLIFSGLWGLVAPSDPIPDYKLKMGAFLPGPGKLSSWWRDELSARLVEHADGRRVWNLLPNEHAAAWRAPIDLPQWSVRFLERRPDGALSAVSHRNKALKGALVRHLLAHPTAEPPDLSGWRDHDGAVFDASVTEDGTGLGVVSLVELG